MDSQAVINLKKEECEKRGMRFIHDIGCLPAKAKVLTEGDDIIRIGIGYSDDEKEFGDRAKFERDEAAKVLRKKGYLVTSKKVNLQDLCRCNRYTLEANNPDWEFDNRAGWHKKKISTANGEAEYVKTEFENEEGKFKDDYYTKDGYWVLHEGNRHHVYKVKR